MASKPESIGTGIEHDGTEVGIRAKSQHSRRAHKPRTDDNGDVIFVDRDGDRVDADHDAAMPLPECDAEAHASDWDLKPVDQLAFREKCTRCFDPAGIKERNSKNAKSKSWARKVRYGADWGDD